MIEEQIKQQSEKWFQERSGRISASRICHMLAEGDGLTREKYKIKLAIERLTGKPLDDGFKTKYTERGNELEPEARDVYEIITGSYVEQIPFMRHPTIEMGLASPDSLVNFDGLLEIKCPAVHTHINYVLTRKIPRAYMLQMYFQMACTGRQWCDFMSYFPEAPINIRSLIIRVARDEGEISAIERQTIKFNEEVDNLVKQLREMK
jgi:putative phage-type endonuclease